MPAEEHQITPKDRKKIDTALESCQYTASEIGGIFTDRLLKSGFALRTEGTLIKENKNTNEIIAIIPNDIQKILPSFYDKNYLDSILASVAYGSHGVRHKKIQIIGPYNAGNHWQTCEVNIERAGNKYICTTYLHNPFGGGQLSEAKEQANLAKHIRTAFFTEHETFKFEFPSSPYKSKRQNDFTSCGPIVAEEIIQLATTGKITQTIYPEGALAVRKEQLKLLIAQDKKKQTEGLKTLVAGIKPGDNFIKYRT